MTTEAMQQEKTRASDWFRSLRDQIVQAFEALEDRGPATGPAGRFEVTPTRRTAPEGGDAGGGLMSVMRGGRVFEKVGVNISTVHGTFSEEFRKAIPGAVIEYCVFVTNSGTATATAVVANDTLPTETAYLSGTLATGPTCATATTAEDDDPAGPDESDPMGAAYASGTITAQAASLAGGSTYAVRYRVTVN